MATATALLGISSVAGISAYFSDVDTATNTFVVGKVSLDLKEPDWDPPKDITPNEEFKKNPQVENDGKNDEFVFVEVIVPYANIKTAKADGTPVAAADTQLFTWTVNTGWYPVIQQSKKNEDGTTCTIYETQDGKAFYRLADVKAYTAGKNMTYTETPAYRYVYAYTGMASNGGTNSAPCLALKAGETTKNAVFDGVVFCNAIEDQGLETTTQHIIVNAYGIQTTALNNGDGNYGNRVNGTTNDGKCNPVDVWKIVVNANPDKTSPAAEDAITDVKTDKTSGQQNDSSSNNPEEEPTLDATLNDSSNTNSAEEPTLDAAMNGLS